MLEQHLRAAELRPPEVLGAQDRPVDVRLGGEVDDRVAALGRDRDVRGLGDVAVVERHVGREVGAVARVRELVEDDDVVPLGEQPLHEMRADEARATGDQDFHAREGSFARHSLRPTRQCGSSGAPFSLRSTE
jgi:hypothetical protein